MITKIGKYTAVAQEVQNAYPIKQKTSLEKRAFDPIHLIGIGGLAHIGQNALAHAGMRAYGKYNPIHRNLIRKFVNSGKGLPNAGSALSDGIAGGVAPEFTIIGNELGHMGEKFYSALSRNGIDPQKMTPRDIVLLKHLMQGKFSSVAKSPRGNQLLGSLLESTVSDAKGLLDAARGDAAAAAKVDKLLQDMGAAWQRNPLFGNMGRGVAKNMTANNLREIAGITGATPNMTTKAIGTAGELATNAVWGAVDPVVPALNYTKRFMASNLPQKLKDAGTKAPTIVQKMTSAPKDISDKITKYTVTAPVKDAFNRGLDGKTYHEWMDIPFVRRIVPAIQRYGVNYVSQGAQQFAGDVGKSLNAAGFDKQKYELAKKLKSSLG